MKNLCDKPLFPIFGKSQMLPLNIAWWRFVLKQTSGSYGQSINSHRSKLQTKQTVFGILKALLEYYVGIQICPAEHAKGHLNCYSGIHQNG